MKSSRLTTLAAASVLAPALALPAVAAEQSAKLTTGAKPATVTVDLAMETGGERWLTVSPQKVPAGKVVLQFDEEAITAVNEGTSLGMATAPEFYLVKRATGDETLPMSLDRSRVDLEELEGEMGLGRIDANGRRSITLKLEPGGYLLFDNAGDAFSEGAHTLLSVTPEEPSRAS
ncbi:MAG: hypothetical protein ACREDZ_05855 [Kiloniellales bacterium]